MRYSSSQYAKSLFEMLEGKKAEEHKKIVSDFVKTLVRHNRLNISRSIMFDFEKIWREKNNLTKISVEAVNPEEVSKLLKHSLGKNIEISEKTDTSLLGGARITIGDMRVDDTIKRRLNDLNNAIAK